MLVRSATNNTQLDPYVNDLAGQTYTPDVQCESTIGAGSFLNRVYFISCKSAVFYINSRMNIFNLKPSINKDINKGILISSLQAKESMLI